MPSPLFDLIQSVATLRNLEIQQQEADTRRSVAQLGAQSGFQSLAQNLVDPNALVPVTPQFANKTGLTPDALSLIARGTPPNAAATRARAVQRGATQLNGSLDTTAAAQDLTGMGQAGNSQDRLMSAIFGNVKDYYEGLSPEDRQPFMAGTLEKLGTGMDVGSAAVAHAAADWYKRAPKELADKVFEVGKAMAPSAGEEIQRNLGWANHNLQETQVKAELTIDELKARAALMEAQGRVNGQVYNQLNELVKARADHLNSFSRGGATFTPEGIRSYVEQLNAYNQQLRLLAPEIYGPKGTHPLSDMQPDKTTTATGFMPFVKSYL